MRNQNAHTANYYHIYHCNTLSVHTTPNGVLKDTVGAHHTNYGVISPP